MGHAKFERTLEPHGLQKPPQAVIRLRFSYTAENNLQFENVQLSDVNVPIKPKDKLIKTYVDNTIKKLEKQKQNWGQ